MKEKTESTILTVFQKCVDAIQGGKKISRESRQDKEFHFQNWVRSRLDEIEQHYETAGRNSYPDFRIVSITEGYEVKGLAYPGRETNYDCNSQVPTGFHNGRTIFYIFGRYPSNPDGNIYPVSDLVICHGDFLSADHDYVHKNKSIKGFGSYGDIMIRDRKMYVAPTPFGLASGLAHTQTLILPEDFPMPKEPDKDDKAAKKEDGKVVPEFKQVGTLVRKETDKLIIGYTCDLKNNTIAPKTVPNPYTGKEHVFYAWRCKDGPSDPVAMSIKGVDMPEDESEE